VLLAAQAFQVVHEPIALVLGVFEMHSDVNCLFGANLLTIATKDATKFIYLVNERYAIALLILSRN